MTDATPRTQTLPAGQNPAAGAWRENQQRKEAERDALLKLEETAKAVSLDYEAGFVPECCDGQYFHCTEQSADWHTGFAMAIEYYAESAARGPLDTALAELARVREVGA